MKPLYKILREPMTQRYKAHYIQVPDTLNFLLYETRYILRLTHITFTGGYTCSQQYRRKGFDVDR